MIGLAIWACPDPLRARAQGGFAGAHDDATAVRAENAGGGASSKNTVRAQRVPGTVRPIQTVEAKAALDVPEPANPCNGDGQLRDVRCGIVTQSFDGTHHEPQARDPQGVDLDWFAVARRHHPVAHLGVHLCQLHPRPARRDQAVSGVDTDAVLRVAQDIRKNGVKVG